MILLKLLELLAFIVLSGVVVVNIVYQIFDRVFVYVDNNFLSFAVICLIIVVILFVGT